MPLQTNNFVRLFLHFVWKTKFGEPAIDGEIEGALGKCLHSKARELDIDLIAFGGTADHVHALVRSNVTLPPNVIAKHFKGASSHFVNHTIGTDGSRNLYWQGGYGVISVSPKDVPMIQQYIGNQKQHHLHSTLIKELEEC